LPRKLKRTLNEGRPIQAALLFAPWAAKLPLMRKALEELRFKNNYHPGVSLRKLGA
jgi:hypothetical protein